MLRAAVALLAVLMLGGGSVSSEAARCAPTRADALGPFYKPGAPVRSRVGSGYVLTGRVAVAPTCRAIAGARIELWLANRRGDYDDAHRATIIVGRLGAYRFQSNKPPAYDGRSPHIHVRVAAKGYRTLVTQHYPRRDQRRAVFNLILTRR